MFLSSALRGLEFLGNKHPVMQRSVPGERTFQLCVYIYTLLEESDQWRQHSKWFSYLLNRRHVCIVMLVPMPPGGVEGASGLLKLWPECREGQAKRHSYVVQPITLSWCSNDVSSVTVTEAVNSETWEYNLVAVVMFLITNNFPHQNYSNLDPCR
jgi:hypothetical protein